MAVVRDALPAEYEEAGAVTVAAYVADGFLTGDEAYAGQLRDASVRAKTAELIVAVDPESTELLGTVTFCRAGTPLAEISRAGEAEFRMLAVAAGARRRGVGAELLGECVRRARDAGCHRLVLSSLWRMESAHRLYERAGFHRLPERDWEPMPGFRLLAYGLELSPAFCDQCGDPTEGAAHASCARRREFDPPRFCPSCRRRMVVQVSPTGWSARCAVHGARRGG